MNSIANKRFSVLCLFIAVLALKVSGCGGEGDQRKSGTLATPIDFVEKAGENQGKAEDAKKATPKK
ncbi:MAG: hypothetical protein ACKO0V_07190 [bacterium]